MTPPDSVPTAGRWRDLVVDGGLPRLALVCLGAWLTAADALMTATIMPSVATDIGGYGWFGWAVAGYVLGSILAGATSGRLSVRLGLRRALGVGGVTYAAGCAVSALAPEIGSFLAGRLLQGVGGGWVVGLCYVALATLFPERLWPRVLAALSGVWGIATLLSPLIGGLFARAGFWRGAFWVFAAQGVGFALASAALVRPTQRPDDAQSSGTPARQLAALTAGIVAIAVAGVVASVAASALLGFAGLALLALFVRVDARAPTRLLPRGAGRLDSAVGAGLLMIFALSAATVSFAVYGAALLQALYRTDPLTGGYILGAEAGAWTLAALAVAGRPAQSGGRYVRLGGTLVALGVASLAYVVPRGPLMAIVPCAMIQGTGFGLAWSFTTSRVVGNTPEAERAVASSAVPTTQLIGNAAGAAAAGAVANALGFARGIDVARATRGGFWLFAAFVPVAIVGCAAAWRLANARFAVRA